MRRVGRRRIGPGLARRDLLNSREKFRRGYRIGMRDDIRLGLEPLGFLEGWAAVGCEPARMGIGPVPAVEKLMRRGGWTLDDFDLIEVNEAFAVQVLAVLAGWGAKLDDVEDRLNVNGSGISLGHPIGATGVRILTTLLHELRRRDGGLALETMCIGGGQGIAAAFRGVAA